MIVINSKERIAEQRQFIGLLRDAFLQKAVFAAAADADDPHEVWYQGLKCDMSWLDPKSDEYKEIKDLYDKGQSPINSNFFGKLKVGRVWKLEQQGRKPDFETYAESVAKKDGRDRASFPAGTARGPRTSWVSARRVSSRRRTCRRACT